MLLLSDTIVEHPYYHNHYNENYSEHGWELDAHLVEKFEFFPDWVLVKSLLFYLVVLVWLAFDLPIEQEDWVHNSKDNGYDEDNSEEITDKANLFLDQMKLKIGLAFVAVYALLLDDISRLAINVDLRFFAFACLYELGCDS